MKMKATNLINLLKQFRYYSTNHKCYHRESSALKVKLGEGTDAQIALNLRLRTDLNDYDFEAMKLRLEDKSRMTDILIQEPQPMEKLNWLIHLLHVHGETTICKNLINAEIEKTKGKNEFACYKKATILREEGKIQESLETFQLCHKLNPESADNFKEMGKCLYLLRRYRLALEAYLEAEKVSQKPDWEIYHNLGECYIHLGDITKAKEYTQKAVQLGKQEVSYATLIDIMTSEGDLRAAVVVCNSAVESCPDSVSMLTRSGVLYLKIGETQHAFERLSSALALEPSNPKALLGVGCITQNHEEFDVALSKYKIAVQIDSESVALWNNIGMCFYAKQKYIAAITCLKRALWLSPLNWKVLLNLGLVNLSTNQSASAFNFLCAAVNIRPDIAIPFMVLGCALLELKDRENALRALRQALSVSPDDPWVVVNTSLCSLLTGQTVDAAKLLEKLKTCPQATKFSEIHSLNEKLTIIMEDASSGTAITAGGEGDERTGDNNQIEQEEDEV